MINTEKKQLLIGTMIQINFLNINQRVAIINNKTPIPKKMMSLFINDIMSSAIIWDSSKMNLVSCLIISFNYFSNF